MHYIRKGINNAPHKLPKNEHFTQISHLSSNRQEQNSALIPDYNPNKKAHPRHKFQAQQNYLSLRTREPSNSHPERHKFQAQQNYSSLRTKEPSNLDPERHKFWAQKNYTASQARESPKPNQKDTTFEKMHSLTPAKKQPQNKTSIRFPRISYHLHLY